MANTTFSVRLDYELTAWVKSKASQNKRDSDVIREAILAAMAAEKLVDSNQDNLSGDIKKAIFVHRALEQFATNLYDRNRAVSEVL